MVGTLEDYVRKKAPPPQGIPVDDVPLGDYERASLGMSERLRIWVPYATPALWGDTVAFLRKLANDIEAAQRAVLPAPTDHDFKQRQLDVILGLKLKGLGVQRSLDRAWKRIKKIQQIE